MISDSHIFIDIHSHSILAEEENVFRLVNFIVNKDYVVPAGYFSVGIHPWFSDGIRPEEVRRLLLGAAEKSNCLAIGECGLDKKNGVDVKLQKAIFLEHIRLSEYMQKPLIIHSVKSSGEILQLHKQFRPCLPWIIHGFNNSVYTAFQYIKAGMYISISNNFIRSKNNYELIQNIPEDQLFIETDDFVIPIENLYKQVSEIRGIRLDELIITIKNNFKTCFSNG